MWSSGKKKRERERKGRGIYIYIYKKKEREIRGEKITEGGTERKEREYIYRERKRAREREKRERGEICGRGVYSHKTADPLNNKINTNPSFQLIDCFGHLYKGRRGEGVL